MAKDFWIQGAIKHEGSLTAAAKAKGMSISAFCAQKDLSGKMKKKCSLSNTLKKFNK